MASSTCTLGRCTVTNKELWLKHFNQTIGEEQAKSDTNPTDWRAGGRATKEYPNKQNGDWWAVNGEKMLDTFIDWWSNNDYVIWEAPGGIPAIELAMNVSFGGTLVKAVADLVMVTPDGELAVMDFKTGASTPDSSMQLGLYAVCVEQLYGVRPQLGYFYSARDGVAHPTEPLDRWTHELFTELFDQFGRALDAQVFLPNVGMNCKTCGVAEYCYTQNGVKSWMFDPLHPNNKKGTK